MDSVTISLHLEDVPASDAHGLATELKEFLESESPSLGVTIRRDNPATQDMGATLVLLAGTTMATTIASGIRAWLAKRGGASVLMKKEDGALSIKITNADTGDIQALEGSIRSLLEAEGE